MMADLRERLRQRPRPALVATGAAAGVALAITVVLAVTALVRIAISADGATGDFISFYAAGEIVRTGEGARLYDGALQEAVERAAFPGTFDDYYGYVLPAFAAWLFAPFSLLPYTAAFLLWMGLNVVLLCALARAMAPQLAGVPLAVRRLYYLLFFASMPAVAVIVFGQVDLIVLGAMLGGWSLLRRGRDGAAGGVLALAAFKPHFLAGVGLYLLVTRRWRPAAALSAAAAFLLVVPALATSPGTLVDNVGLAGRFSNENEDLSVNAEMMSNVRGLIVSVSGTNGMRAWLPALVVIAAGALALALPRWRAAARGGPQEQAWALAVMLPLLVSPHLHTQSLVLAWLPLALWLRAAYEGHAVRRDDAAMAAVLLGLYAAIFACWLAGVLGVAPMVFVLAAVYGALAFRWPAGQAAAELPTRAATRAAA
jgi:hypothetical protein